MATADKLNKLLETKAAIKQAIINKGVEVGDSEPFANYPNKIAAIEGSNNSGSGGEEGLSGSYVIARFENCEEGDNFIKKATELDVSNLDISNMRNMNYMFSDYNNLKSLDLSSWDISNVENMGGMFNYCRSLETLDLSNFDMTNANDTWRMFAGCNNLHTLRLDNCSAKTIKKIVSSDNFPTGYVFDEPRKMFVTASEVGTFRIPDGWQCIDKNTGEVIEVEIGDPYIIATFNTTESVEVMDGLFSENWLTSYDEGVTWEENSNETRGNEVVYLKPRDNNEIWLERCFSGRRELTSTEFFNFAYYGLKDNISNIFNGCRRLTTINGIGNWDTSNVREMQEMFNSCNSLESLDLSNWDTSNVEDMNHMFAICNSLETLDLSHFDTSNVRNMERMFERCNKLKELDLSNFDTSNVENMDCMFERCDNLETLKLDNCSYDTIARIINDTDLPTGLVGDVIERKMYVNPNNIEDLTPPDGWIFIDCETNEVIR